MIAQPRTDQHLRHEIERLSVEVRQEINDRRRGMTVYDSSIDALMRVHEQLLDILGEEPIR